MASSEADLGQLNEGQQLALQTFTSVTDQETSVAIPLLQRSQWNVQIAIAKFFDGEAPDPVEEARASPASSLPPQQSARREVLINDSPDFPRSSTSSSNREPAPRIIPQAENQSLYKPHLILSLLLTPFNLLYRLVSGSLGLFGYLFPSLPRLISNLTGSSRRHGRWDTSGRKALNPRDCAARFAREFEEEYGSHALHFFENGYAQAYDLAKRDLKYLLVVLISPEHDDTSAFVRETLLSEEVISYINDPRNNIILWAGSVQDSEAYQVSAALNCTKFPFAALVAHTPQDSSTAMATLARISGLVSPSAFLAKLQTAVNQQSVHLDRARSARAEQQAMRNLREEQNSAYERSLAQDRERARQRREAEAVRLRAEEDARAKAQCEEEAFRSLTLWKRWRAQKLPPEPGNEAKEVTRVSIRMPSGERVLRKFAKEDSVEDLYAFVECYDLLQGERSDEQVQKPASYEHVYKFRLVSPLPRVVFEVDAPGLVGEKLGRSENLIVEQISQEEGEESSQDEAS